MITISSSNVLVKIKTISSTIIEIKINRQALIKELKDNIALRLNIEPSNQKLIFHGKILHDDSPIAEYKLEDNDVIHIIECNSPQSSQLNPQSQSQSLNSDPLEYLNYLQMLTQSINTQNNIMNMFFNQDLINNLFSDLHISDSFLHLQKQINYNRNDSIEALTQNFALIYDLIGNTIQTKYLNNTMVNKLFNTSNTQNNIRYQIGQWVDVLDPFEQWKEAQIIELTTTRAHIHYAGWSNDLNEWIRVNSERIAMFRSHTIQSPFSRFYCPFPNKRDQTYLSSNVGQYFDKMGNMKDMLHFIDVLKERIDLVLEQKVKIELKEYGYNKEEQDRERQKMILLIQLYPLMDRIGRLLLDYSAYLMNYSFSYFENNLELFKENLTPIPPRSNIQRTETQDEILKRHIFQYEKLTQLCPMRNPGELAETFRLIRPVRITSSEGGANFQRQRDNNTGNNHSNNPYHPVTMINNRHLLNEELRRPENDRPRQEGGLNSINNRPRYHIDYLNQIDFINTVRRFQLKSLNIIKQDKFSYIVYNKYPVKTFDIFTQTFDNKPTMNLMVSSNNNTVEYISKLIRMGSSINNNQQQLQKQGRYNSISVKKDKIVIMAKSKPISHQNQMNNSKNTNANSHFNVRNGRVNKYKLILGLSYN